MCGYDMRRCLGLVCMIFEMGNVQFYRSMPRIITYLTFPIFFVLASTVTTEAQKSNGQSSLSTVLSQVRLPSIFELLLTRYRFEDDGTGSREVIAKIRILDRTGTRQHGEEVFEYRPLSEQLKIRYVRVTKTNGSMVYIEKDVTQPVPRAVTIDTDHDERRIRIPELHVGDLLEYDVLTTLRRPLGPGEFCMQHNFQASEVIDERLEVDLPGARDIKLKSKPTIAFFETASASRKIYHWEYQSPQALVFTETPYVPGRAPDVQISSFASWEEVGRWFADIGKDQPKQTKEIKAKADELTKGLNDDKKKVEALYNFTAQQIKYLSLVSFGIGGYILHLPSETLRNKYGDCKDKVALLSALLEAEDLHPSSVLISHNRVMQMDIPSPWFFDHVIASIKLGTEEVWMDPSPQNLPFGTLPHSLVGKPGLVVLEDGTSHFERTPPELSVEIINRKN